jgi:chromate reductase
MDAARDVAVFIGSLRKDSINRKVANALVELAPPLLKLSVIEIGQLPLYNQDGDENPPAEWTAFRERVKTVDAVLFVTPEHNRSVPAAMKNALDIGSRPYGQSVWNGKPGAVVSASPGAIGGFGANQHLRQSLVFLNVPTMQQPEAYIGGADKLFNSWRRLRPGLPPTSTHNVCGGQGAKSPRHRKHSSHPERASSTNVRDSRGEKHHKPVCWPLPRTHGIRRARWALGCVAA